MSLEFDAIFVGGGLSGVLAAYRMQELHPERKIIVLESGSSIGGNHTWCFHESDLSPNNLGWVRPFVSRSWSGYQVKFPNYNRLVEGRYYSVRSERLDDKFRYLFEGELWLNCSAEIVSPTEVIAENQTLVGDVVFDCRGPDRTLATGYQKFVGWDIQCRRNHQVDVPTLMDATVDQREGYRFVYTLPWSANRLLVEDTRYSSNANINLEDFEKQLDSYVRSHWGEYRILRRESGALPIPGTFRPYATVAPTLGMRGGMFHPATGYSFADTVALAERIACLPSLEPSIVQAEIANYQSGKHRNWQFFRYLNRMLFEVACESDRLEIMQRFYRLPEPLLRRFYAARLHVWDVLRIMATNPPISKYRALMALLRPQLTA